MRIAEQLAAGLAESATVTEGNETALKFIEVVRNVITSIENEVRFIEKDLQSGTINGDFVLQNLRSHNTKLTEYLKAVRYVSQNG